MASRTKNITIDQGADFVYTTTVYGNASTSNVLTLGTDYTANAQMRQSHYHANATITFECSIASNEVTISANNEVTANAASGRYVYDVELKKTADNSKIRVLEGIATVTPEVTKIG